MIQSLESLHRAAQERGSRVLAVAAAQDAEVLLAVDAARKLGIATAILVGDEASALPYPCSCAGNAHSGTVRQHQ